jgi:hypothetical protein
MNSPGFVFLSLSFFGFGASTVNFDNVKLEKMPPYWTATETDAASRLGPGPRWEVARDKTAPSHQNVFAQVSSHISPQGAQSEIPLAIFDKVICRDGDLSVKFKIDGTRKGGSAGMVWRYQDPRNYYLLRFSADEKNIALFRVQDGHPHAIPVLGKPGESSVRHEILTDQWYVAKVSYRGSRFRVLFGNRALFEGVDDSIRNQGKTGLSTKAGTIAEFDDFRIDKKS